VWGILAWTIVILLLLIVFQAVANQAANAASSTNDNDTEWHGTQITTMLAEMHDPSHWLHSLMQEAFAAIDMEALAMLK
jgi:hypothetical protein